jgi:hypothetical protein
MWVVSSTTKPRSVRGFELTHFRKWDYPQFSVYALRTYHAVLEYRNTTSEVVVLSKTGREALSHQHYISPYRLYVILTEGVVY